MRAAAVLVLFFVCLGAGASVFRMVGRHWSGWVPTGRLPWDKAYETGMVVNGRRVDLHVFTTRYTEPVAEQLKGLLVSIGAEIEPQSTGLNGVATLDGCEVKYVVSSPPSEPRHLIFLSYSDPNGAVRQEFPLRLYPNGEVLSTVSDLNTGAEHLTFRTMDVATQVHEFYRELLESDGWTAEKPPRLSGGQYSGLGIYSKKGQICFIDVVREKNNSSTVVVLLEKGK